MVLIKAKPYNSIEEDISKLDVVCSGETYEDCLRNLVNSINEDTIDTENNKLIISSTN